MQFKILFISIHFIMAATNMISLSVQQIGTTPPSKLHRIGVASILDVLDFTDTNFPFIKSVVFTSNPVLSRLYVNESASAIETTINS